MRPRETGTESRQRERGGRGREEGKGRREEKERLTHLKDRTLYLSLWFATFHLPSCFLESSPLLKMIKICPFLD